jgi:hypothetical protein
MKKTAISLLVFLKIFLADSASAWNDSATHPHITERATEISILDKFANQQLLFQNGMYEKIGGKTISEWLQYGAEMEDDPACRASNHFHNPYKPWFQAGLTDTVGVINWWCWATTDFPAEDISSNLVWATGYLNRSGTGLDFDSMAHNEWDWQSAREYFYTYLTGLDLYGIPAA